MTPTNKKTCAKCKHLNAPKFIGAYGSIEGCKDACKKGRWKNNPFVFSMGQHELVYMAETCDEFEFVGATP